MGIGPCKSQDMNDHNRLKKYRKYVDISLVIIIGKISVIIGGGIIIISAVASLINGNWGILGKIVGATSKTLGFVLPALTRMVFSSLAFIWLPIIAYVLISLITVSRWWRFYLCLVVLGTFILFSQCFISTDISISNLYQIIAYLSQIYLLALWTFPREIWNFLGGIVWFIKSMIILILPDLPGYFDDFGAIGAIFAFIFLYLHTIASLIQRFVDTNLVTKLRIFAGKIFPENR